MFGTWSLDYGLHLWSWEGGPSLLLLLPFLVHRAHVGAGACLPLSQVEDNALYSVDGRLFWPDLEA